MYPMAFLRNLDKISGKLVLSVTQINFAESEMTSVVIFINLVLHRNTFIFEVSSSY